MIDADTFFRMLADGTRLRALMLMQREGELCVCELTHAMKLSQPKISRHLAQLRETGMVQTRRAGQWMFYRVSRELPAWARTNLRNTLKGVGGSAPFDADYRILKAMPNRPDASCCT